MRFEAATAAMQGLLSHDGVLDEGDVEFCVEYADDLLAALDKKP
jgi:hypothetical protein